MTLEAVLCSVGTDSGGKTHTLESLQKMVEDFDPENYKDVLGGSGVVVGVVVGLRLVGDQLRAIIEARINPENLSQSLSGSSVGCSTVGQPKQEGASDGSHDD